MTCAKDQPESTSQILIRYVIKYCARNVRLYYPYWQYTNLFIFRNIKRSVYLRIRIVKSNVSSIGPSSERNDGFSLTKGQCSNRIETLDYTIHIVSTPTFLYFDLYLYSAYAAHYV